MWKEYIEFLPSNSAAAQNWKNINVKIRFLSILFSVIKFFKILELII